MALYKGSKDDVQARPLAAKSALLRKSASPEPSEFIETPLTDAEPPEPPPPPKPPAPFEEGLSVTPAAAPRRVLGGHKSTMPTQTNLQPLTQTVCIGGPSGGSNAPSNPDEPAQVAPVIMQTGPPVDQAIIEEAQQKAAQIMQEAQAAANQMLMEYQQQAQMMMEQANAQIQQAAEQVQRQAQEVGYQNGYQEGLATGSAQASQQLTQLVLQARDLYVQAIRQRKILLETAEPELARLATKVAEKILGMELKTNPEAIVGIAKTALAGLGDRESVSIRVHPDDYDVTAQHQPIFERMVEGLRKFEIIADAAIDQGGCSIETNLGNVDARLNTQLNTIRTALEDLANQHDREIREEAQLISAEDPQTDGPATEPEPPEA